MERYVVKGPSVLKGSVKISGSKNAALPLMVASLLTDEDVILHNVPDLMDVRVLIKLLEKLGKSVSFKNNTAIIKTITTDKIEAPYDLVKKMRASIVVLGPLLAKHRHCRVSLPGGCAFGPRPVDLHIKGLEMLGAKITLDHGYIEAKGSLKGCRMALVGKFGSSVLATDNVMMAATLAKGETIIESAAMEPECEDLANMLIKMGADISGGGTSTIKIKGVTKLNGVEYNIIPDRIEAGTFLAAAAATRGSVQLHGCKPEHLNAVLDTLAQTGVKITVSDDEIHIKSKKKLTPFTIDTLPYPAFPTDLQSPFTALASSIKGTSSISERIYPDRFTHAAELVRMGADIEMEGSTAIIRGGNKMIGTDVQASDLRAGAALVIAALASDNTSRIHRIYHIDRGYENFEEKLKALGANIKREKDDIL